MGVLSTHPVLPVRTSRSRGSDVQDAAGQGDPGGCGGAGATPRIPRLRDAERRAPLRLVASFERLRLSGKLDLLILTPDACYPVDFQDTEGGPRENHRLQLVAYALLAGELFERPAPDGFIYLVPERRVVALELNEADRGDVRSAIVAMRRMIEQQKFPPPTPVRGRCVACEFRNYCADIW